MANGCLANDCCCTGSAPAITYAHGCAAQAIAVKLTAHVQLAGHFCSLRLTSAHLGWVGGLQPRAQRVAACTAGTQGGTQRQQHKPGAPPPPPWVSLGHFARSLAWVIFPATGLFCPIRVAAEPGVHVPWLTRKPFTPAASWCTRRSSCLNVQAAIARCHCPKALANEAQQA
jgi:hypothetical protein